MAIATAEAPVQFRLTAKGMQRCVPFIFWSDYYGEQASKANGAATRYQNNKSLDLKEESLRTKENVKYGVNWKIVKSKEYSERFNVLSDNEKVNQLAATRSRNALVNRDGKNTEELYAINMNTGKDVSSITNQHYEFGVKRTDKFNADLNRAEENGDKILLIHNHPRGLPPSIVDINSLLQQKIVLA